MTDELDSREALASKNCDFIGSFFDFAITSEILRVRNKKWPDPKFFGNNILEKYGAIMRVKPRCYIALNWFQPKRAAT